MLRIYITSDGLEGYHEGCSCCSSTEHATDKDIRKLCDDLEKQRQTLFMLLEILDDHTEDELTYWYKTYVEIQYLEDALKGAERYRQNPNIQGTYYKEAFDNVLENTQKITALKKKYAKFPAIFKKYMKEITK